MFFQNLNSFQFVHFQSRLAEVLQKWQQYEKVLEECDDYIGQEVSPWLVQAQTLTTNNIQDAQKKLQETKVS